MSLIQGIAAAGSLVQGIGGLLSGQHNRHVYDAQANEVMATNTARENLLRHQARAKIGEQLAAQYSNGMYGGSGTALDAVRESQINAVLDAREMRRQAVAKSDALRAQGSQSSTQGWFDFASGLLGASKTVAGYRSDWAQAHVGSSGG